MSGFKTCVALSLGLAAIGAFLWLIGKRSHVTEASEGDSRVVHVSKAVDYRYFEEGSNLAPSVNSDALVLDVDLSSPTTRLQIAADNPERRKGGKVFGVAHTVRDWCFMNRAVAGVNGGFFGATDGMQKQAEGLLLVDRRVYNAGRWVKSTRRPGESFLRCALAIGADGLPQIGWATCQPNGDMRIFDRPLSPAGSHSFDALSAVACGPRLVAAGHEDISDEKERLVSALALPRTFIAYDCTTRAGKQTPHHFVMGIAMQMTYHDVALFLRSYFRKHHGTECAEAMCLDGGSSSQLAYREPANDRAGTTTADDWVDTRPSRVTVPTALLVTQK